MASETIGILGSGDVGRTLGDGFARHGWDVTLGTRSPERLQEWLEETDGTAAVGSFADATAHGDQVVLAVLGDAAEDVIDLAGPERFADKLVLDSTNPLDFSGGGAPHLLFGGTDSLGERIQRKLPASNVVKCFNTVSHSQMVEPDFEEGVPPMLICGNDTEAKVRTETILQELGWPGILDVGGIESARYLEALVPLWVRIGSAMGTWEHAFKVVR